MYKGTTILIAPRQRSRCCPVKILSVYLKAQDARFKANPYLLLCLNGEIPTWSWYISQLQDFFGKKRTGHSLWAGGATALAEAGMSFQAIQVAGRWKSDAFLDYIHSHPTLNVQTLMDNPIDAQTHVGALVQF